MNREWEILPNQTKLTIRRHQDRAPIKLSALARELGVSVRAATLPAGISGELRPNPEDPDRFIIRVNRHDSDERQRFTVAHELGHFLLHKGQIGSGIKDDVLYRSNLSDRREAEANRLAACLLMPEHLIEEWLGRARLLRVDDVVNYLAEQFEVSEASMKIRLGLA